MIIADNGLAALLVTRSGNICLAVSVFCIAIAMRLCMSGMYYVMHARKTKGRVSIDEDGYCVVTWRVEDQEYSKWFNTERRYYGGETVMVIYDHEDPANFKVMPFEMYAVSRVLFILGTLLMIRGILIGV